VTEIITRDELVAAVESGAVVLLEALPPMHYEKEHLPGALNLPLDDIDTLSAALVPDRDRAIVTYCSNTACNNSAIAAARLRALSYTDVRKYPGGKQDWIEAGLPVERAQSAA